MILPNGEKMFLKFGDRRKMASELKVTRGAGVVEGEGVATEGVQGASVSGQVLCGVARALSCSFTSASLQ